MGASYRARMIERYYDAVGNMQPRVTQGFLTITVIASILAIIEPNVDASLRGTLPRLSFWQPFTAAFVHGWPGTPVWMHLALSVLLVMRAGPYCERLLGHGRFALLCVGAMAVNGIVMQFGGGVNGASIVVWAWGPSLWLALKVARETDPEAAAGSAMYQDVRWVLRFVYIVLVMAVTALPYLYGYRGDPVTAFLRGNLHHMVSAGVGAAFTMLWAGTIRSRIREGKP